MSAKDFGLAIHDALTEMRNRNQRLRWVHLKEGKVYFRLTRHLLGEGLGTTIDLANFEIYPTFRRRGYMRVMIWVAEQFAVCNGIEAVYVESILNPVVGVYLRSQGYVPVVGIYPDTLYKRVGGTKQ